MKTEKRLVKTYTMIPEEKEKTIYIADDGSEHESRKKALERDKQIEDSKKYDSLKINFPHKDNYFDFNEGEGNFYKLDSVDDLYFLDKHLRLICNFITFYYGEIVNFSYENIDKYFSFPCIIYLRSINDDYQSSDTIYTQDFIKNDLYKTRGNIDFLFSLFPKE